MARRCTVCDHLRNTELDRALLAKEVPVTTLAETYAVSTQALYRHTREHLSRTILKELRLSKDVSTSTLLEHLTDALADVAAVRSAALIHGDQALLLRSATVTQSLVGVLMERLAPDGDLGTVRLLHDGETMARAIGVAVKKDPAIAAPLAHALRSLEGHELADALVRVATLAATKKEN